MARQTYVLAAVLTLPLAAPLSAAPDGYLPPERVSVLPVFIVPADQTGPSAEQVALAGRHLAWTRDRYREMLHGRDTFEIADRPALVIPSKRALAEYRALPQGGAPEYVRAALEAVGESRFTAPYVFLTILMNPENDFPGGGGRPLNGGVGTGGGVVILSSYALERAPNFQSTLQHELGHAFGLLHSDAYGFDMGSHPSVMSYNPAHHTKGFEPSPTPGVLCPEDVRALARNRRVFPRLRLDPAIDIPAGYPMPRQVRWLPPMEIPGQLPYEITATSDSGEDYGSRVANMLLMPLVPSRGPGNTYNGGTMWHSGNAADGWVEAEVAFPCPVCLTAVGVHTQHSGVAHAARAVTILALAEDGWQEVVERDLAAVDETVSFAATTAQRWRFRFRAGESRRVVVRGLRFFLGETEVFPPFLESFD